MTAMRTCPVPEDELTSEMLRSRLGTPLPLPGHGATAERFEQLVAWGREDLAMAKVLEPHADAAAILDDLEQPWPADGSVWAVWAAEPPFAVLTAECEDGAWHLTGSKAFCSGASLVSHAVVTARSEDGPRLFSIDASAPGIRVDAGSATWEGPGMRRAGTETLTFDRVRATAVGGAGDYTGRAGFWFGAVGVAACWLGGAIGVADTLERSQDRLDAHGAAHLGAVRARLLATRAALHLAATMIDTGEVADIASAQRLALEVRATAAETAEVVISHVGRALGPGPLAFDGAHAARVADLQVFVRQHHAERDLEQLGRWRADG